MILISPFAEYPRFKGDLLLAHPDWKDGDSLPTGWIQVVETEIEVPTGFIAKEIFPELVDGIYYQTWQLEEDTSEPATHWQPFIPEE